MKTLRVRHSSFLPAGLVPRWRTEERSGHLLAGFGWFVTFSYDDPDVWIAEMGPFESEEVALDKLRLALLGTGTIDRLVAMGCKAMLELCEDKRGTKSRVVSMCTSIIAGWYLQYQALVAEHAAGRPCRLRVKR